MGLDDCRARCTDKLLDALDSFVLANDCLHSLLARGLANPCLPTSHVALQPCPNDGLQRSCCDGSLASQCRKLLKEDVQTVFFDVFLGNNSTSGLALDSSLINAAQRSQQTRVLTSCCPALATEQSHIVRGHALRADSRTGPQLDRIHAPSQHTLSSCHQCCGLPINRFKTAIEVPRCARRSASRPQLKRHVAHEVTVSISSLVIPSANQTTGSFFSVNHPHHHPLLVRQKSQEPVQRSQQRRPGSQRT